MSNSGKVTLENSIKGDIDLELIGNSVQPTTTGKNIFDESKAVTGRINPDNGELLPETSYISSDYIEVQEGETYFQSGSGDGYYRAFYDMNKKFTSIPTKGVFKITVPVGSKFLRISGRKERFGDWQLEKGDKATPYEPYTGGKPSPRPDNPQEIKSTGRKSKNLFDINYFKDKSNLKTLQYEGFTLLGIICNVKPNTNYTLSANITEAQYNLNIANKGTRFSLTSSPARTLMSNDDGTLCIGLFNTTADAVNMYDFMQQYKNIQLEKGNTVTYYEAYSDKYLLDVKVTGKNLFDVSQFVDPENIIGRKDFILQPSEFKVGMTYTCSAKIKSNLSDMNRVRIDLLYEDGTNGNTYGNQVSSGITKCSFTPNKKIKTLKFILQSDADSSSRWTDVMIEHGNKLTEYEPYQEPQTLTLTSDRPITKWDKLVEQGGEYGWLYQSTVKAYRGETAVSPYKSGFYFLLNNKKITKGEGYCSELKQDVPYEKNPCINFNMESNTYAYTLNTQAIYGSSVSEIKEYLKIHPLHLVYKTEATEFVPLSESEQTQLRNLHSYNGTTNITVDSGEVPCGIKVAYKQKK